MFFFYNGSESIEVLPPGEQYATTISPNLKSQRTNNERLYNWLFDKDFEHNKRFVKTTSFAAPSTPAAPKAPVKKDKEGADV